MCQSMELINYLIKYVTGPSSIRPDLLESKVHELELKAYEAVLRAFKAQSNELSWSKDDLLTELRKELRVSSNQHGNILRNIMSENMLSRRENWSNEDYVQKAAMNLPASHANSVGYGHHKKMKIGNAFSYPSIYSPRPQRPPTAITSVPEHSRDHDWGYGTPLPAHNSSVPVLTPLHQNMQPPSINRVGGELVIGQSDNQCLEPQSNIFTIHETMSLLSEVESVLAQKNPDPAQVQKLKSLVREQEMDLARAITKLDIYSSDK